MHARFYVRVEVPGSRPGYVIAKMNGSLTYDVQTAGLFPEDEAHVIKVLWTRGLESKLFDEQKMSRNFPPVVTVYDGLSGQPCPKCRCSDSISVSCRRTATRRPT